MALPLAVVLAAAVVPAVPAQPSCAEVQVENYIMDYTFTMKQVKRLCGIHGLTVTETSGLLSLLRQEALAADVATCVDEVRAPRPIPVLVSGARRGWYKHIALTADPVPEGWSAQALDKVPTSLGAVVEEGSQMYAVIHRVTQQQLDAVDATEGSPGWCDVSRVTALTDDAIPQCAKIRWYPLALEEVRVPTAQFPIRQSFVDLFVSSALELGDRHRLDAFVRDVLDTTFGWNQFWVNDRTIPYSPESTERAVVGRLLAGARTSRIAPATSHLPTAALRPLSHEAMQAIALPGGLGAMAAAEAMELEKAEGEQEKFQILSDGGGRARQWVTLSGVGFFGLAALMVIVGVRIRRRQAPEQRFEVIGSFASEGNA